MPCAQNSNVIASGIAFTMSLVALIMGISAMWKVEEAFRSMGSGSELRGSGVRTVVHLTISMILNLVSFCSIGLSTFHFEQAMKFRWAHTMSSSTAFCTLRITASLTFLVQLLCSSFIMVGMTSVLSLDLICHMGSTARFHAQEVIWEIGNFTLTGKDPFDPYRTGSSAAVKAADTRFVSVARMAQHLELDRFCPHSENLGNQMFTFWLGSIISLVSQALMAIALNGEKERVNVHEENDEVRSFGQGAALLDQSSAFLQAQAANAQQAQQALMRGH